MLVRFTFSFSVMIFFLLYIISFNQMFLSFILFNFYHYKMKKKIKKSD